MWNVVNKAEHWVLSDINISISDIFCFVSMVRRELPDWIKYINVKSWQFRILFLDNFNFVVGGESSEKWEVRSGSLLLCCVGWWARGEWRHTGHCGNNEPVQFSHHQWFTMNVFIFHTDHLVVTLRLYNFCKGRFESLDVFNCSDRARVWYRQWRLMTGAFLRRRRQTDLRTDWLTDSISNLLYKNIMAVWI